MKLNYEQTLVLVEHFMEKSGIRKFCTNICKGKCCSPCQFPSCFEGKRKLSCSLYVCNVLESAIIEEYPTFEEWYHKMNNPVKKELHRLSVRDLPEGKVLKNIYFGNPDIEGFSIDSNLIERVLKINPLRVKKIVETSKFLKRERS